MSPPRRLPDPLSEGEVDALLAQINDGCPTGLRNRALLQTMLYAGLRLSETLALKPAGVDFSQGLIRVHRGKGARDRVVPVGSETLAWVRAWMKERERFGLDGRQRLFCTVTRGTVGHPRPRRGDEGPGFSSARETTPTRPGRPLHPTYVQQLVRRLANRAGIEKRVTPHVLRHTYATRLLESGYNVREVQTLLGHANVANTQIYTHVRPEELARKIQVGAPIDSPKEDEEQGDARDEVTPAVLELAKKLAALPAEARKTLAGVLLGKEQG